MSFHCIIPSVPANKSQFQDFTILSPSKSGEGDQLGTSSYPKCCCPNVTFVPTPRSDNDHWHRCSAPQFFF